MATNRISDFKSDFESFKNEFIGMDADLIKLDPKERNRFFESKMAIILANNKDLFPIVQDVSDMICKLIQQNRSQIKEILSQGENFNNLKNQLYKKGDFGSLGALPQCSEKITIDEVLNDIVSKLNDKDATLIETFPIHATVTYRIFRLLFEEDFLKFQNELGAASKLIDDGKKNVKVKAKDSDISATDQFGLSEHSIVCQEINELPGTKDLRGKINPWHRNSLQRFIVNIMAAFFEGQCKNNLPSAAGPSSHTVTALVGAKLYTQKLNQQTLSSDQLKEYALAYFAYFGTAGYHTFTEVMQVAAKCIDANADYKMNYEDNLPSKVLNFLLSSSHKLSPLRENSLFRVNFETSSPKEEYKPSFHPV